MELVKSTYKKGDCIYLLKDLTGIIKEVTVDEKERLIAQGVSYSEMISKEHPLSKEINDIFLKSVNDNAKNLAKLVGIITEETYRQYGENMIIVSLARAGSPVGVLMKRYAMYKYGKDIPHYSISIIRGKGIDENALNYIREKHPNGNMAFVDGWTGKGSITFELRKAIAEYNKKHNTNINDGLIVLADPACKSKIFGTREDICIPNACLNSTVSGLVSRTIHNPDLIGEKDFHGAKYFADLKDDDFSNEFIDIIEKEFTSEDKHMEAAVPLEEYVDSQLKYVMKNYDETDPTRIKLSIGESSRALLRRKPKVLIVGDRTNPHLAFVLHLATVKGIPIVEDPQIGYECVSVLEPKEKIACTQ